MKLNLHPKGIPKQEPLGADTPLKKGGVVVGMRKEGDKEKIYFVGDDCHLLCVGATRSGKSRCLVLESICLLGLAGESIFCSDPKAELFHYTADFLKKLGYEVLVLDFKNPEKSMRYNLLQPIIDAISEGDTDRAEMLAWDLTNNLVGKPEGEKIWTNGECSIIAAAILCVVCDNQKRPEFQNMTNVYWFISEMCRTIGNKMPLLEYVKKLSPSHPARALLSISDVAPSRTRGSFYTSALTTLRLFTSKSIYAITHTSDFIITYLGMGIVWFTDPPEQPEPTDYDYEYRVDTDVITPVTLYAGSEINPDSPATVSFSINGSTYRMNNIVIPSGDSQIAWVKWHTPSEPQDITIYVSTNKGSLSQSTIRAKVVDLSGNDPPDPKATDTMGSWSASSVPSRETKTYAAWSVWWAKWHPYWVWHSTGKNTGYWVDDGWYDYFRDNYSASMTATTRIEPDEKVPTASGDLMKSGYGVTNTVTATVSTSAPLSHYTYGQTAVSYFPEFGYGTYWRLLERLTSGTTARFQFAKNIYSTYNQRVHFSPVWFPDGSYTVNTHVMDIWTPAGMLAMNLTDDVTISGSLYDDWHIAPGNP